nr:hypothetical protein [Helicobacter japonicus]
MLYPVTEVPKEAAGRKRNTKEIDLVAKLFDRNFVILNLTNSYNSNRFNDSMINLIINIRNKDFESIKASFDKQLLKDIAYSKNLDNIQEPFQYEFFKNVGYENLTKKFLRYFFARVEHYLAENSNQTVKNKVVKMLTILNTYCQIMKKI